MNESCDTAAQFLVNAVLNGQLWQIASDPEFREKMRDELRRADINSPANLDEDGLFIMQVAEVVLHSLFFALDQNERFFLADRSTGGADAFENLKHELAGTLFGDADEPGYISRFSTHGTCVSDMTFEQIADLSWLEDFK